MVYARRRAIPGASRNVSAANAGVAAGAIGTTAAGANCDQGKVMRNSRSTAVRTAAAASVPSATPARSGNPAQNARVARSGNPAQNVRVARSERACRARKAIYKLAAKRGRSSNDQRAAANLGAAAAGAAVVATVAIVVAAVSVRIVASATR